MCNAPQTTTPDLAIYTPDPTGFFEAVAIEGLEGKWLRVSYADQRRFFGRIVFGRRAIMVMPDGQIKMFKIQDFGKDFDLWTFFYNAFDRVFYSICGRHVHIIHTPCGM